jgi:hypothetical protein
MPAPALRPRSATEIVDTAFQILRAHYGQFVVCSAIGYVPMLVVQLVIVGDPARYLLAAPADAGRTMLWSSMWTLLGGWLTFTLMSAVLLVCTSQAYLGETVDVGAAVRRVLPRAPQVLIAAFLRYVLMMIALLLLVLPVLYVVARYFAVTPAIVLEDAGVGSSFSRSSALAQGRKWHVLITLGLVALIYWVLVFGITILASLPGSFILQTLASAVATILVYPVVAIAEALLYYDARIKSEGLDIELMTGALAPMPSELPSR